MMEKNMMETVAEVSAVAPCLRAKRPRRAVRVPRVRLGFVAVAVALVCLVGAGPVHAQTDSSLASNIDNAQSGLTQALHKSRAGTNQCCANPAQRFTTGSNATGYSLTSVKIRLAGATASGQRPVVTIRESKDNDSTLFSTMSTKPSKIPGSVVATLTAASWPAATSDLLADNVVTFNAPDNTNLSHSTDYFVHIEGKDSGYIPYTRSGAQTTATGWSIADEGWWYVPYWKVWVHHSSRKVMIDIVGAARTTPISGNSQGFGSEFGDVLEPFTGLSVGGSGFSLGPNGEVGGRNEETPPNGSSPNGPAVAPSAPTPQSPTPDKATNQDRPVPARPSIAEWALMAHGRPPAPVIAPRPHSMGR